MKTMFKPESMKKPVILMILLLTAVAQVAGAADEKELLKFYKGDVVLPPALYQTYEKLVAAMETGKQEEINPFCVPGAVRFTTNSRPKENQDYGQDINLPFLKGGFHKFILNLRKDSESQYLIRTGSTALWFARSDDGTWKLSKYLDKPIA